MAKNPRKRSYSYFIMRSPIDDEFVATFLELPGLSGLADTVREAILELNQALDSWAEAVRDDELPEAIFDVPVVIIDRSFLGQDPLMESLFDVLPENIEPEGMQPGANTLGGNEISVATRNIQLSKDKRIIQL